MKQSQQKCQSSQNDEYDESSREEYRLGESLSSGDSKRRRWTLDDDSRYISFLSKNLSIFQSKTLRKRKKVFKKLSEHMGNKSIDQTKSHHQKMMKKHGHQERIIQQLGKLKALKKKDKPKRYRNKGMQTSQIDSNESQGHYLPYKAIKVIQTEQHEGQVPLQPKYTIKKDDGNDWFNDF